MLWSTTPGLLDVVGLVPKHGHPTDQDYTGRDGMTYGISSADVLPLGAVQSRIWLINVSGVFRGP